MEETDDNNSDDDSLDSEGMENLLDALIFFLLGFQKASEMNRF